jgi:ribosome modulation factor
LSEPVNKTNNKRVKCIHSESIDVWLFRRTFLVGTNGLPIEKIALEGTIFTDNQPVVYEYPTVDSLQRAFDEGCEFGRARDSWWLCPFGAGDPMHQLSWLEGWTEGVSERVRSTALPTQPSSPERERRRSGSRFGLIARFFKPR